MLRRGGPGWGKYVWGWGGLGWAEREVVWGMLAAWATGNPRPSLRLRSARIDSPTVKAAAFCISLPLCRAEYLEPGPLAGGCCMALPPYTAPRWWSSSRGRKGGDGRLRWPCPDMGAPQCREALEPKGPREGDGRLRWPCLDMRASQCRDTVPDG